MKRRLPRKCKKKLKKQGGWVFRENMRCEDCGGGLLGETHEPWCLQ